MEIRVRLSSAGPEQVYYGLIVTDSVAGKCYLVNPNGTVHELDTEAVCALAHSIQTHLIYGTQLNSTKYPVQRDM